MNRFVETIILSAFACWATAPVFAIQDKVDSPVSFSQQIRPILSNHCFQCHGPDEEHREAGLRLDQEDGADFEEVLNRITSEDSDTVMPPPRAHKDLKPSQVKLLKRWIKAGAKFESHWAFVAIDRNAAKAIASVDEAISKKLQMIGKQRNPSADRRTLARRLSFDLTGLPPTIEEVNAFVDDQEAGAYERLVDRILRKPQYGEHMARYWLDLVRFADTNGLHHDHFRQVTPYRDWVIRSFNENLGFDDFIVDQLAGDLHATPTQDQLIASGFNRLHLIIDVGTALPAESFHRNVVDRVSSVGTAFLGLTLQCAECHDHKYDPVSQKEFYQLYGFFNNFDGGPETGGRRGNDFWRGLQEPYINLATPEQTAALDKLKTQLADWNAKIKPIEEQQKKAKAAASAALKAWQAKQKKQEDAGEKPKPFADTFAAKLKPMYDARAKLKKEFDGLEKSIPAALVMKERSKVRPTHLRVRGVYDDLGEEVKRRTPAFLPPLTKTSKDNNRLVNRMDLARWLVRSDHPLTARVAVNRFWQQLFGVGLVKTSEDFGAQGEAPSHPALLDHLTVSFVDSGWDVKKLIRTIVLSKTYRQSAKSTPGDFRRDPHNRMLARGSRFRLDAETIRDQVLSVTGLLNEEMHGKSVKPPQPKGLWKTVAMPSSYPRVYQADSGAKIYRRSVYTFWKRAMPPPQMTIFDAPTREACIARRERTNTPLQALLMMNESQYFAAALHMANAELADADRTDRRRIELIFEKFTSRKPSKIIGARLEQALGDFRKIYQSDAPSAKLLVQEARKNLAEEPKSRVDDAELASWTMLVHSLFNLDVFKARE